MQKTKKIKKFADLWNPGTLKLIQNWVGKARLVSLNKKWPQIPGPLDFRPITVLSPLFKWLESRFLQKLNTYLLENMEKSQTGFVPGFGTLFNVRKMISAIRKTKSHHKKAAVFIDYSSAFNCVNRGLLYEILKKKQILTDLEIEYINCLHSMIHYVAGGETFYFRDGVPQGSLLSPALFDIYIEEVLVTLQSEFPDLVCFAYADDIAFIVGLDVLEQFLHRLEIVSNNFQLKINRYKSAVLFLKRKKIPNPDNI
jgi:Reverse transcriptase (RNA-dependent DNA polymerase)